MHKILEFAQDGLHVKMWEKRDKKIRREIERIKRKRHA